MKSILSNKERFNRIYTNAISNNHEFVRVFVNILSNKRGSEKN